ncbi:hypothetical protein FOCC_FOCC016142 [Frankliniella occidentalis]|nr:hypothetical protein FOCC_FOCC016142 [Frankliniella occidentalis]
MSDMDDEEFEETLTAYAGPKPKPVNFKAGNLEVEWSKFKQKFSLYLIGANLENATPKVKFAQMLGFAGDDALEVYNSFKEKLIVKETNAQGVVTEIDNRQDYESVVREFDLLARDQKNLTTCRETFDNRNQKSGEPFANWLTDLKNLIQHCDYDTLEDSLLKDRIIRGTNDKRLSETLRGKPKLTLEEVIDVCKGVEASLKRGVNETVSINVEMLQAEALRGGQFRGKRRGRGGFRGGSKFNSGRISKNQGQRGGFRGRRPYQQRGGGRGRSHTSANKYQCRKCDRWHQAAQCPAYGKQCTNCSGWNHFAVVCTRDRANSGGANNSQNPNNNKGTGSAVQAVQIMALTKFDSNQVITSGESKHPRKEYTEVLKLDNQHYVKFKLDPGAEVNVLPVKVFQIINRNYKVRQTNVMLKAFGQVITKAEGTVKLLTETKAGAIIVTEYILSSVDDRPILGIEDCERLNLIKRIHSVDSGSGLPESKDEFIKLYSEVFTGLGQFKQTVKILIDPSVKPGMCPPRRYNYSITERLKPKLNELEQNGIIAKVTDVIPKFVSNLCIREKPNGDLRLCLDPAILNQAIIRQKYAIPTVDEISCKVKDKKIFTVLDLKDGFWHASLDEESSLLCSFSTPYGIYKFLKMPFGISSAPEVFQFLNDQTFQGIDVIFYFDDCLVAGKDYEEHDKLLKQVLERAAKENIRTRLK